MKKAIVIGFLSLLLGNMNVYGQEDYYEGDPFSHWAVGINAGLYGVGVEGSTHLIPNIKLRAGFNYFGLTLRRFEFAYNYDEMDEDYPYNFIEREGTAKLTPKIEFVNGKVLFDILPWKTGIFAFTTGVYIGKNSIKVNGTTYDENGNRTDKPMYVDDGIIIYPDSEGHVAASLRMGNIVKPYFGLTIGRTIPRQPLGLKFEMGVVYQGSLRLESNSTNDSGMNRGKDEFKSGMNNLSGTVQTLLKLWPIMQLQLTYKIK